MMRQACASPVDGNHSPGVVSGNTISGGLSNIKGAWRHAGRFRVSIQKSRSAQMENVERLLKGTVEELDRLLNAKNVLGDPIEKGTATVIPIVSYGFGFGAGGSDNGKSGNTSGTGAGGGIKPLGAIIIDDQGARVESVQGAMTTFAEVLGTTAGKVIDTVADKPRTKNTNG
ncbi:GerW family sporulation protein [uncultured Tateyamaria sp.]|uniref:GerW family sporulation protein n=1 Tax=uncultured Tateyamaria sp. TaxID=455651 RepID=UPI002610D47C|nr:spore germination protein GerW family protein [uncultured Tateyamaria sp.]